MPKPKQKLFALGIVAHPDDEAFLLAATCRRLSEEGKKVGVICATKGEMGADRLNRGLSKSEMAKERMAELKKACNIIKVAHLEFLNYKDGKLDQADQRKLAKQLAKKIDELRPSVVLTFGPEGISGHRDHTAIGAAATKAASLAVHRPDEVWLASVPRSIIGKFNEHLAKRKVHHSHFHSVKLKGVPDKKLLAIKTGKHKSVKLKAIKAHKSQYLPSLILDNFLTHEYFEVVKIKPRT